MEWVSPESDWPAMELSAVSKGQDKKKKHTNPERACHLEENVQICCVGLDYLHRHECLQDPSGTHWGN